MDREHNRSTVFLLGGLALLVLLLLGCSLGTATPTALQPAEAPTTTLQVVTDQPEGGSGLINYQPGIGSTVLWADQSYVVYVPAGDLLMGQDVDGRQVDYEPAHTVSLDAFWIHQTEVTNRQYRACVEAGICSVPYRESGKPYWYANLAHDTHPVVGVNWNQAVEYCTWIQARLPSEAEWEMAARGIEGDPYPWGDETPACDLLNFTGCQEIDQPVRVRSFFDGASPFLLADTAGNVAEWVQDWYDAQYYQASPSTNPAGPATGTLRVVRSSDYESPLDELPVYLRDKLNPYEHQAEIGFRCVLTGESLGNPPPPVCEVPEFVPWTGEDRPYDYYPPEFTVSSFCMPDSGGSSQGTIALVFPGVVTPGMYDFYSSEPGMLLITIHDDHTVSLFGDPVPVETMIEITICDRTAPDLPVLPAECPPGYYYDDVSCTCRYGDPSLHDTPGTCGIDELFVPGYGCLHACDSDDLICGCPLGYDFYEGYTSPDLPGTFTLCLPPDGPEDCLTDPDCSANNECLPGLTYDAENDCCNLPPDVPLYCPPGFTLKIGGGEQLCEPPELTPLCTSFTVYIDSCDQLVCTNPSSYSTASPCIAAGCRWVVGTFAAPSAYCTFP